MAICCGPPERRASEDREGSGSRLLHWPRLGKETFCHRQSSDLLDTLDRAARAAGKSRSQTFEDWLELAVCALSGGRMEEDYLKVAQRYAAGEHGQRGIDLLARTFGQLVQIMEQTRADVLGDLFQGAITCGENSQHLTPEAVADCMARMAGHDDRAAPTVADPCCGSGRMLLAAARVNHQREFVGQDIDLRCVRMTAINLALRGLYGVVIWGNALSGEQRLAYRTGFDGTGFIRPVAVPEQQASLAAPKPDASAEPAPASDSEEDGPTFVQRDLF